MTGLLDLLIIYNFLLPVAMYEYGHKHFMTAKIKA